MPAGNPRITWLIETVVWPGLPGLADPEVGPTLIQFAGAFLEVRVVDTPQEIVPELLVIVRTCGGGTRPEGEEKFKESGETGGWFAETTFKVMGNVMIWFWQRFAPGVEQLSTAV